MPTTNPVPSTDPTDLLFNAGKLDEVVNGTANSFTDRLGVARRTVAGMNADFDAQLADAESDLNVYRADAAASAAEALGYLQTIRATSYGAYASDPATDPLGNPPTVGDEYFNTTANLLKRWNGTTWQASDINTANLAAPSGASLVGYDGGTVQDVMDSAKPMANYTALRNYTGRATSIRITQIGLAGFFQRDDADTTSTDNSGTIIVDASGRRWKRLIDGVVNMRWFGAVGNGEADDTIPIQRAIDATPAGGELRGPSGTYMIKATGDNSSGTDGGIIVTKSIKFNLDSNTILKAITGNKNESYILHIKDTSMVDVSGGQFIGDRLTNTNTAEWGHAIYCWNCSNIYIHDVSISNTKGDGLRFAGSSTSMENFLVENVVIDGFRRWGFSSDVVSNLTFRNVTIKNHVAGLGYGGGVDLEDEYKLGGAYKNVTFENCLFLNNVNYSGAFVLQGSCKKINIINCVFDNSRYGPTLTGYAVEDVKIIGNTFRNFPSTGATAIFLKGNSLSDSYAKNALIIQNYFGLDGVNRALYLGGSALDTISNVIFENNIVDGAAPGPSDAGIFKGAGTVNRVSVKNNILLGGFPINLTDVQNLDITNNLIETSVSPALTISSPKAKASGNRVIASGNEGIQITSANVLLTDNTVIGARRWSIYVPTDGTGSLVQGNFIDASSGTLAIYAPAPTGAKSFFMNNVAFAPVGAAFSIAAGHVSVNNQSA